MHWRAQGLSQRPPPLRRASSGAGPRWLPFWPSLPPPRSCGPGGRGTGWSRAGARATCHPATPGQRPGRRAHHAQPLHQSRQALPPQAHPMMWRWQRAGPGVLGGCARPPWGTRGRLQVAAWRGLALLVRLRYSRLPSQGVGRRPLEPLGLAPHPWMAADPEPLRRCCPCYPQSGL